MATMYELDESNSLQNRRAKLIRLIEFSDHIIRLNRRENIQLESRLRILQQQETIIRRNYERDIYSKRFHLAQLYQTLNEPNETTTNNEQRLQTPVSFYAIRMRRNQSAPPPISTKVATTTTTTAIRPTTTPANLRANRRAMSVFKQITLKPTCSTMDNLLLFVENPKKKPVNVVPPTRSRTMLRF